MRYYGIRSSSPQSWTTNPSYLQVDEQRDKYYVPVAGHCRKEPQPYIGSPLIFGLSCCAIIAQRSVIRQYYPSRAVAGFVRFLDYPRRLLC
jgi:hypothetical protein